MNGTITEVSNKEVARFIKYNSIQSVLHFRILRDNSGNEIFIFECIRNCHITVIHIKTIYPADKQSRRIFDL